MKLFGLVLTVLLGMGMAARADDAGQRAWELESKGDAAGAYDYLRKAVETSPQDPGTMRAYAEFLDEHRDLGAREAYRKLLALAPSDAVRREASRRLVILDMLDGNRLDAARDAATYQAEGGPKLTLPSPASSLTPAAHIEIPGPLRSFARMAALSPDLPPEALLPDFARNIVTNGYQAAPSAEALEQTEYLKLVVRYLSQARELARLAGPTQVIKVPSCDSSQTADILRILGYRMRGGCGSELVLETVNATRAFLTIDSGFPLATLEESLRTDRPFVYDYHPTEVPVLFGTAYWAGHQKNTGDFIDFFISDPALCRLYLGFSKLDPVTAAALRQQVPMERMKAYAHVLDFFGSMFEIRNGKAIVPGGAASQKAWAQLVGVNPEKGAAFFERLISRDDGWMASYFDALARINGPVSDYLTEPQRMIRFYAAIRGRVTSPGPARPVFRSNADLMLLTTMLRLDPDGQPHIPGSIDVWKELFVSHPHGNYDKKLSKLALQWKTPDDVLEALFALCRKPVENEPLKIFMAVNDMDRKRPQPLRAETVSRLAHDYPRYGAQYDILAEVPELTDQSIDAFLDTAQSINQVHDTLLRADTAGTLQGLVSIWQILYRQGSISPAQADAAFNGILAPFARIRDSLALFDAGRAGVKTLLAAAGPAQGSPQDRMVDLMAGAPTSADPDVRTEVEQDVIRVFEAQRLISLDTLFDLANNLEAVGHGAKLDTALVNKLSGRIAEVQLPRSSLSPAERNSLSFGYWTDKHIEVQRKVNLRAAIDKAHGDAAKLGQLRGLLAPFLRDTIVGFSYAHYAPPGAQVLYTNPAFVRSHDFIGVEGAHQTWNETEVFGSGWPSNAGGRLVGSLSSLPYALAQAEQNFLIPSREQALIWGDLVPQMIVSATVPRWWGVTPAQEHWVGLHMAFAETVLAEASFDPDIRSRVLAVLARQAPPLRVYRIRMDLDRGDVKAAAEQVVPSEMFMMARDLSNDAAMTGPIVGEIRRLAAEYPKEVSDAEIARCFGTPKPTLTDSYAPGLLNLRTFPTLMGYSSRIMAESWESNLLYYAALADQIHMPPAELNVKIPEWTEATVQGIFATHLEDWPALLRSLRSVGDNVRAKARKEQQSVAAAELRSNR
jgi:hypothetical protein